ncbi:hypothetical protein HK099_004853 [Clydaea vesicula]|uniref:Gamma tubulin complex component C-terminal domain-containing protein n=1 Tax=Clydaea vesicula TaxID=447962 RepID=A0AAD5TZQ4_9FUNG|nr:hypothetical protein HK099_004853 [Clydaea vesicula]
MRNYIPKYIMVHTCEQILFAGKAVATMEKKQELILDKVILNDILDQLVRTLPNAATNFEWDNRKFELSVQNWKDFVSNELWNFVVDNDLSENLNDFRSIFLLGEGQVFQEFISEYEESQSNALKNFSKSTEYGTFTHVLESNFQKLYQLFFEVDLPDGKKRVNKKDFESAVQLKDIILDSIMKGLFLEKEEKKENKINLKIMKMFTICDEFTTLINFKLEENHIGEYYSGRDDPKMLAVEFQEISDSLFRIFDGAKDGEISNYLELLLTRLDFNRWFSVGNLNLSI